MANNINIDVKVFEQQNSFNDYLGFNSPQSQPTNTTGGVPSDLDGVLGMWTSPTNSNNNGAFSNINNLYAGVTIGPSPTTSATTPPVENYGGFQFKNSNEKTQVDSVLTQLRAEQAANPGKAVSKKIKVGKYKITVTLNADGSVSIKRKKKGGFFSKLGGLFKGIGNILKKALPIISMVAMFVPGLQPLALAARVASGFMGVIDGIKNGNIFGALTSAVGAFSGVGGKVGSFFSGLGSKASGLLSNIGGSAGNWVTNAFNSVSSVVDRAKQIWSGFTGNIGSTVSNFLFDKGSNLFGSGMSSFGSSLLKGFADNVGNRAVSWLNNTASNVLSRVTNNPVTQKVSNFLNSGWGQFLTDLFRGNKA